MVVALGATDAVTYTSLRTYLFQQLDSTLSSISAVPNGVVVNALYNSQNNVANNELGLPNGTFAAIYDADTNGVLAEQLPATAGWTGGIPNVPVASLERSLTSRGQMLELTTSGTSGSQFRLSAELVVVTPAGAPRFFGIFVVAIPINGVTSTAHRLLVLELLVTLAVLIALALAAWLTVRIGLRPLEEITETAGAIAAGDLSQRIKQTDDTTEVGRLGSALNVMLGRIETAFREREASEARLRRFVADASHELRTPLTSIRGYAELFQHGLVDRPADLDTAMRRIDSESVRMAGLVDDLLLLARLDQGRPLEREPVDLTALATDAAQDTRAVDPSRTVTVDAPSACYVDGDDGRLRQLLGNLVSNALAYTPSSSPIEITAALETSDENAKAKICVVDHGPGIPAEAAAHVFERFWRLDPARVHSHGGAGLGLSIVAAVAQAHGGTVSIRETTGGGATFTVELPVEPEPGSLPWGMKDTAD
jgi:two-component system OmpR family sensor kinase